MARIEFPPETEDYAADPSELFFDLAYVFAFSQIVGVLVHHPDWAHVGKMALLFILLWIPWQQFTWSANAVPGNSRPVRILILVATVVSVPMAASVSDAYGAGAVLFAVCVIIIFLLGIGLMLVAADRSSSFFASAADWLGVNSIGLVLLLVGSLIDGNTRVWLWAGAAAVATFAAWRSGKREWLVRPGHFAERHGLITIVALGEVIVAIGLPVVESLTGEGAIPAATIAVLAATGAFAGLLWWGYFDRIGRALEHRATTFTNAQQRAQYVRTVYTWDHAPIVAGIVAAAAGLEYVALHPGEVAPLAFRLLLIGGLALMVVGYDAAIYTAYRGIPIERTVTIVVLALICIPALGNPTGLTMILIVDVAMLIALVVENQRIER